MEVLEISSLLMNKSWLSSWSGQASNTSFFHHGHSLWELPLSLWLSLWSEHSMRGSDSSHAASFHSLCQPGADVDIHSSSEQS